MAHSSSATVTSSAVDDKKPIIRSKGVAKEGGTLERDPIEVKYKDFFWTYTEEPHRTRRLAIIKAHPEVRRPGIFSQWLEYELTI